MNTRVPSCLGGVSLSLNVVKAVLRAGSAPSTMRWRGLAARGVIAACAFGGVDCLAAVSVSPTSVNWVSVTLGNTGAQKAVTLSNTNTAAITISSINITGANPGDFKIYSKTCGTSLAASSSCIVNVVFAPAIAGARSATLNFNDSGSGSPQTAALTGKGVSASGTVSVSPTSIAFGSVTVSSTSAAKVVTLSNGQSSSITISGIAISGTNAGDFAIASKTCGSSLGASSSCTVSVTFKPGASGTRSATLSFTDNASNSPQKVALSGTGATASGSASISPTSLNWVSVAVGNKGAAKAVTLKNGGSSSINISSIAVSGTNPGDFLISSKTCGTSLAASASCSASIVFAPTTAGNRSAVLGFYDSASNSPQSATLTGLGTGGSSSLTISPLNPSVAINGTLQFTSSVAATWTATCGSIGGTTGVFTAPATTGSCTVKATATGGSGQTAQTTVTITTSSGQVTVTPGSVAMHAIGKAQFTANKSVTWSATCGSITTAGLFTAPATAGTCTIKATSTANSSDTGSAAATIKVVNYTTRKGGNDGTGRQLNELVLTPTSVSSGKFGQLWSVGLDGSIWGQPLYMNGLNIGGKLRNVVYVATNNDSVYAFDADTGTQLWKKNFLSTGVTAVTGTSLQISSQTGILSTAVIDPVRQVIYVVAETAENSATYFPHRLHALNLITGAETTSAPKLISHPNLVPLQKFQRPGLLLANGNVYVGFGAVKDRKDGAQWYHGLLFAFDAVTLEQKAVFDVAPTGIQGGIWMSGASPLADSSGNVYISTGNGTVSTNNYGESIVKLSPSLQELDHFTVYNYALYDQNDLDLGSGSMLLVPDQNGQFPHEVIACGKPTPIYVLNRDSLGGLGTTNDNIIQRLDNQLVGQTGGRNSGQPCYGSPAMWQQNVYFAANNDVLKMFVLNPSTGLLSTTPAKKGTFYYQWPGSDPVVSSNGNANGIVWTLDYLAGTLHASDATDVSKELYRSPSLGTGVRWVPPTVVNGHVYMGISNKIIAFGMTQ